MMAYLDIVLAWLIVSLPFGWIGFSFYKALDTDNKRWLVTTALSVGAIPLYFMVLVQLGKDLAP